MTDPAATTPPPAPPPGEDLPKGLSITALVLGIAGVITPCFGDFGIVALPCAIAAIVVGGIALSKARRGEQGGTGMAITGIALGVVALVLGILILLVLLGLLAGFAWFASEQGIYDVNGGLGEPGAPGAPTSPFEPVESLHLLRGMIDMLLAYARLLLP